MVFPCGILYRISHRVRLIVWGVRGAGRRLPYIDDSLNVVSGKSHSDTIRRRTGRLRASIGSLLAIALWIVLESGRPAVFRQARVGKDGRVFEMHKFRTLRHELSPADDPHGHLPEDVTRSGRFLRATSLDELPQLFNILAGTMSLVGPRPEMPYLVDKYQPWQRKRFAVPPGLTGWWQVNGRSDKPMHLNTEDDLYYIQNYSIWLDLQILFQTVPAVLKSRGAY